MTAVAVAGLVTALLGQLHGPGAMGEPAASTPLAYHCPFPSASQPVHVRVDVSYPDTGLAGEPIQPTGANVAMVLPPAALADLATLNATSVVATMALTTTVVQDGTSATTTWTGQDTPDTPVPAGEELVLTAPATVPDVTIGAPGEVTVTAAELTAELHLRQADGTPTAPATLSLACTLDPGQDAHLATVAVTGATSMDQSGTPPAPGGSIDVAPEPERETVPDAGARAADFEIPPGCHLIDVTANASGCAKMSGFANVDKLNAAVFQPPGLVNIAMFPVSFCGTLIFCQPSLAELNFNDQQELPPAPASFLPFGFVPTRAVMQLIQESPMHIDTVLDFNGQDPDESIVVATADLTARIFDATVNGVPLDVGPHCRTIRPIHIVLTADTSEYTIPGGGPLDGFVEIPEFSGCGATEDLDPLFTGLVSGPDNYVKMTQGTLCSFDTSGQGCPPTDPEPQR